MIYAYLNVQSRRNNFEPSRLKGILRRHVLAARGSLWFILRIIMYTIEYWFSSNRRVIFKKPSFSSMLLRVLNYLRLEFLIVDGISTEKIIIFLLFLKRKFYLVGSFFSHLNRVFQLLEWFPKNWVKMVKFTVNKTSTKCILVISKLILLNVWNFHHLSITRYTW